MPKSFKIIGRIVLFLIVAIIIMFLSASKVLILLGIGGAIAFIVADFQIYLDRKNLAKMDKIDEQ